MCSTINASQKNKSSSDTKLTDALKCNLSIAIHVQDIKKDKKGFTAFVSINVSNVCHSTASPRSQQKAHC